MEELNDGTGYYDEVYPDEEKDKGSLGLTATLKDTKSNLTIEDKKEIMRKLYLINKLLKEIEEKLMI